VSVQVPGRRPTTVAVIGRVAAAVEPSPAVLVLPRASGAGDVYHGTVVCRSNERLPLTLLETGASDRGLSLKISPVAGNPHLQSVGVGWDRSATSPGAPADRRVVRLRARVGGCEVPVEFFVDCLTKAGS